jgi:hypothetical protein
MISHRIQPLNVSGRNILKSKIAAKLWNESNGVKYESSRENENEQDKWMSLYNNKETNRDGTTERVWTRYNVLCHGTGSKKS